MLTGSPGLWHLAEQAEVVPTPPDATLARMLSAWWAAPRVFGCVNARTAGSWNVVMPSPSVLCVTCAGEAFETEDRCAYCGRTVRRSKGQGLLFEMTAPGGGFTVNVLGRCHRHCSERARKIEEER